MPPSSVGSADRVFPSSAARETLSSVDWLPPHFMGSVDRVTPTCVGTVDSVNPRSLGEIEVHSCSREAEAHPHSPHDLEASVRFKTSSDLYSSSDGLLMKLPQGSRRESAQDGLQQCNAFNGSWREKNLGAIKDEYNSTSFNNESQSTTNSLRTEIASTLSNYHDREEFNSSCAFCTISQVSGNRSNLLDSSNLYNNGKPMNSGSHFSSNNMHNMNQAQSYSLKPDGLTSTADFASREIIDSSDRGSFSNLRYNSPMQIVQRKASDANLGKRLQLATDQISNKNLIHPLSITYSGETIPENECADCLRDLNSKNSYLQARLRFRKNSSASSRPSFDQESFQSRNPLSLNKEPKSVASSTPNTPLRGKETSNMIGLNPDCLECQKLLSTKSVDILYPEYQMRAINSDPLRQHIFTSYSSIFSPTLTNT